jgi:hypothetical protein
MTQRKAWSEIKHAIFLFDWPNTVKHLKLSGLCDSLFPLYKRLTETAIKVQTGDVKIKVNVPL